MIQYILARCFQALEILFVVLYICGQLSVKVCVQIQSHYGPVVTLCSLTRVQVLRVHNGCVTTASLLSLQPKNNL